MPGKTTAIPDKNHKKGDAACVCCLYPNQAMLTFLLYCIIPFYNDRDAEIPGKMYIFELCLISPDFFVTSS